MAGPPSRTRTTVEVAADYSALCSPKRRHRAVHTRAAAQPACRSTQYGVIGCQELRRGRRRRPAPPSSSAVGNSSDVFSSATLPPRSIGASRCPSTKLQLWNLLAVLFVPMIFQMTLACVRVKVQVTFEASDVGPAIQNREKSAKKIPQHQLRT